MQHSRNISLRKL